MNWLVYLTEIINLKRVLAPRFLLIAMGAQLLSAQSHRAADLGRSILAAGLDSAECYRVRDLEIAEKDAHFYLTDGYLLFGKPVNGAPLTAVFSADTEGGDAEVLLLPPERSERKSLASYTGAPNLNEHFQQAAFIFTDAGARSLIDQLRKEDTKRAPEIAPVMVDRWSDVISNLLTSFESRIVLDLLTPGARGGGFFQAVIQGRKLGNFDVLYDARGYEQLVAGQIADHKGTTWWDTWTSFESRSHRGLPPPLPEQQILSYSINVTMDASLTMHCITRMRVRSTADSRNVIPFDLSGLMHATSAKVDGQPAEMYERDSVRNGLQQNTGNELLLVLPDSPLEPGTEHEVEIAHEGRVLLEAGHQVYFANARGSWYPGRGMQFASYDVTFRYPKTFDLVTAGKVVEDRTEGDDRITRRVPDGRVRLLGFNFGQYERKSAEHAGLTVEVCANRQLEDALRPHLPEPPAIAEQPRGPRRPGAALPGADARRTAVVPLPSPVHQIARIAGEVETSAAFYRARFGEPPVTHLEVSPLPGRFGQGFGGMIYLPTLNYLTPGNSSSDSAFFGDLLTAHEVAHQWWGNVVTSGSYHHEWLMEALANYSAILYLESRNTPKALETALESYKRALFAKGPDGEPAESEGAVVQGRRLASSNNPAASFAVLYGKGTWIIHMLRRRMGDERFFSMLAELRRRFEWKTLDTESFRALCAEFMPPKAPDGKLEAFFDQWVYGTGVPTLKLSYSVKGKAGAYKLTGTLHQSDAPDDFSTAVPIEIQTGHAKPVVQIVRSADGDVPFSFPVSSPSAKAILDPGLSVLRR